MKPLLLPVSALQRRWSRWACLASCLLLLAACGPTGNDDTAPVVTDPAADLTRLAELQALAAGIRDWYASHGELPASLGEVRFEYGLQLDAADTEFDYEILGAEDYQLCAVFSSAGTGGETDSFWQHGAGTHCYRLSPTFAQY